VLADDQVLTRKGLLSILEEWEGVAAVQEATDAKDALARCREIHPDLVLLDLEMPPTSTLETLRQIHLEMPRVAVVMLAQRSDDEGLVDALAAGAVGFYVKSHEPSELLQLLSELAQSWGIPLD
jgi:DNA-binding NarL/FixJ family response regulator